MPWKGSDRSFLVGAYSDLLAVATILGCQHQLILNAIVIAFRPTVIGVFFQLHDFLGGELRVLIGREQVWPVLRELVAAVHGGEQTPGGIKRESLAVAQSGGVAFLRREMLILFVRIIEPGAGTSL